MTQSHDATSRFVCPRCKDLLEYNASLVGTKIKCPMCEMVLTVPPCDRRDRDRSVGGRRAGQGGAQQTDKTSEYDLRMEPPPAQPVDQETDRAPPPRRIIYRPDAEPPRRNEPSRQGHEEPLGFVSGRDDSGEFDPFAPFDEGRAADELAALGDLRELYETDDRSAMVPADPVVPPDRYRPCAQAEEDAERISREQEEPSRSPEPYDPRERFKDQTRVATKTIPSWQTKRGVSSWGLFFRGTFLFPFSWDSMAHELLLVGIAVPWFFFLVNLLALLRDQGNAPAVAMFSVGMLTAFSFVCGGMWAVVAFSSGFAILRDTSYANDEIEWPNVLLFDCLGDMLYIFAALCYSALPGSLLCISRICPERFQVLCVAGGCFFLFPVVLLSMLECNSPVVPFTRLIGWSLFRAWWAWLVFYLLVSLMVGVTAAVLVAIARLDFVSTIAIMGGVLLNLAWVVYFRLFGRLAWYCSYVLAADARAEDDQQATPSKDGGAF